jgi:hypothetical protein
MVYPVLTFEFDVIGCSGVIQSSLSSCFVRLHDESPSSFELSFVASLMIDTQVLSSPGDARFKTWLFLWTRIDTVRCVRVFFGSSTEKHVVALCSESFIRSFIDLSFVRSSIYRLFVHRSFVRSLV